MTEKQEEIQKLEDANILLARNAATLRDERDLLKAKASLAEEMAEALEKHIKMAVCDDACGAVSILAKWKALK